MCAQNWRSRWKRRLRVRHGKTRRTAKPRRAKTLLMNSTKALNPSPPARQVAAAHQTNAELGRTHEETLVPNSAQASDTGKTRDKLAKQAGVGKTKFDEGRYVLKYAPFCAIIRYVNTSFST